MKLGYWWVFALAVVFSVGLAVTAEAECCTAVPGVCSECCPGPSCGCVYAHETGKCVCTGCKTEVEAQSQIKLGHPSWDSDDVPNRGLRRALPGQVAVFLATPDEVQHLRRDEIDARRFSQDFDPVTARVSMKFNKTPADVAIRLIAKAARFDVELPSDLKGTVEGLFSDLGWKEALDLVLRQVESDREVVLDASGLVRLPDLR